MLINAREDHIAGFDCVRRHLGTDVAANSDDLCPKTKLFGISYGNLHFPGATSIPSRCTQDATHVGRLNAISVDHGDAADSEMREVCKCD